MPLLVEVASPGQRLHRHRGALRQGRYNPTVRSVDAPFLVSLRPGCVDTHAVSPEQIDAIRRIQRPPTTILTEVADGPSELNLG